MYNICKETIQELLENTDKLDLKTLDELMYDLFPKEIVSIIYDYVKCEKCSNCCNFCKINCYFECPREMRDICSKYEFNTLAIRYNLSEKKNV